MEKDLHKYTMKNEYRLYRYIHSNPHLAPTEVREQKFAITCSMSIDCHTFRCTNIGAISALDTCVYAYIYIYIYNVCVGRPRRRWEDNIRMDLQEVGLGYEDWIGRAQDRERWRALVCAVRNLRVP